MGHSYFVLGAGMGRAIAHCLAEQPDTSSIVIGDLNTEKARSIAGQIMNKFPVSCGSIKFDANDPNPLKNARGFAVVISTLPAKHNLNLAEACIRRRTHFCDLGGVLPITLGMKGGLDFMARENGVSIVPDCGLMPGLGVMVARKLVYESLRDEPDLKAPREVVIYVGGLPQKPVGPLYYQKMFSLEGLKHLCYDEAAIIKKGRMVFVPARSDYELLRVDELRPFSKHFDGMVEASVTSGASLAPWSFRELGVTSLCEKTVRWPSFFKFVQDVDPELFEEMIAPLINIPVDTDNPDFVWMKVAVKYWKTADNSSVLLEHKLLTTYDQVTGLTAMEQTTGFTTALIAQAIARGQALPGVNTPDEALIGDSLNRVITETGNYFQTTP